VLRVGEQATQEINQPLCFDVAVVVLLSAFYRVLVIMPLSDLLGLAVVVLFGPFPVSKTLCLHSVIEDTTIFFVISA